MKNRRILTMLVIIAVFIAMMPTMAFADDTLSTDVVISPKPVEVTEDTIVILATNDVHCGLDDNIGYAGLAAYKKAMEAKSKYVSLVDCGDSIQGGPIGTLSKGEYIVDIMNEVGYDLAIPGNHEFDYGMDQFLNKIVKTFKGTYLSCNFVDTNGKPVLTPYVIKAYGDKKVAFVGVDTPETFTKSTPTYFQNDKGEYIYGFCEGNNGKDLYNAVQKSVDAAKKDGADYVIALAHLGTDPSSSPWTSAEVIKNTTGIDALIDGHSHTVGADTVKNKDGKTVATVSAGTKFNGISQVVIEKSGRVDTYHIGPQQAAEKDQEVDTYVKEIQAKFEVLLNKVVAKTDVKLRNSDDEGKRLVRSQETNLGDLCADAYKNVLGADVAFVNGGGVRKDIEAGDITYGQIIDVHPFGNMACVVEATGQQIADALELGSMSVGEGESGGFLQVSGLTYTINPFVKSSVVLNDKNEFVKVAGLRRVSDVTVGGKPIDLKKTYKLAAHNYMLKSGGDGYTMFKNCKILQDEVMIDNQVLITYIQDKLKGVVGKEYSEPQGRIKIMNAEEAKEAAVKLDAQIKEMVKSMELVARSVKTDKGNIKVSLTVPTEKIEAIQAAGYTVKYKFYRSTKKFSKYYGKLQKNNKTYINTYGTKGVRYYYKGIVKVYTPEGKLLTWSQLKNCKYACRVK